MNIFVLLVVLFTTLKLLGLIVWSWWLVVSPLLVWFVLVLFYAAGVLAATRPK